MAECADCAAAQLPPSEALDYQLVVFHAARHPFKRLSELADAAAAAWKAGYAAGCSDADFRAPA